MTSGAVRHLLRDDRAGSLGLSLRRIAGRIAGRGAGVVRAVVRAVPSRGVAV